MIRHLFLDKTNTIIRDVKQNLGLNPILQLGYGTDILRGLIHFDIEPIKEMLNDGTFPDRDKLTLTLKMTNCMSVDSLPYEKTLIRGKSAIAKRAVSFGLILFKLPQAFVGGRGFDYQSDFWIHDKRSFSTEGSNWYEPGTGFLWDGTLLPASYKNVQGGIYTSEELSKEYAKYKAGEDSIIVGEQFFEFGNENLSIDVTKYVYVILDDEKYKFNNGLCLAFLPEYEYMTTEELQYVGFFTDHTNTFFHPYVEAKYCEYINDDRESFTSGKENRLYLYVSDDGTPVNLDNIPVCSIDGTEYEVKQATKGVYYAVIPAGSISVEQPTVYYDIWSEIALNGAKMDDVEMEFVANPASRKISIGNNSYMKDNVVPSLYGINDDESVSRGEEREITVDFRVKYDNSEQKLISNAEYRLYVMDGTRDLDVIPYQPIEKSFLNNFFVIHTQDLIPNEYFIDIKVNTGREKKYFKKVLRFKVISNVTERYQ